MPVPALVAGAVGIFAVTNIDDLAVLTVLFGSRRPERRAIWAGQYLGMAVLVAVSAVAAIGLLVVSDRWVGLFGVVPLTLGVRGLLRHSKAEPVPVNGMLGVAGVTIANGADNVSVYIPLFRHAGWATIGYVAVFAVLVGVWLAAAMFLASRPAVASTLDRWGDRIVPIVFIVIGVVILATAMPS